MAGLEQFVAGPGEHLHFDSKVGEMLDEFGNVINGRNKNRNSDKQPGPSKGGAGRRMNNADTDTGGPDGDSSSETPAITAETPESAEEKMPLDRYLNNADHQAYDSDTAYRYSKRVDARAQELAAERSHGEQNTGTAEYAELIAQRAAEIAIGRSGGDSSVVIDKESPEFRKLVLAMAKTIVAERTAGAGSKERPKTADYDEAQSRVIGNLKIEGTGDVQVTAADLQTAQDEDESGEVFSRYANLERANSLKPTAEDYRDAQAELQPKFDEESNLNAAKHADLMKMAARAGINFENADDDVEKGFIKASVLKEKYNETDIEVIMSRKDMTKEQAEAYKKELEELGVLDMDALRKSDEIPPRDQSTRAERIADSVELYALRGSTDEADITRMDKLEKDLEAAAELKVDTSKMGRELLKHIDSLASDPDARGEAESQRRTWVGREKLIVTKLSGVKALYGMIEGSKDQRRHLSQTIDHMAEVIASGRFAEVVEGPGETPTEAETRYREQLSSFQNELNRLTAEENQNESKLEAKLEELGKNHNCLEEIYRNVIKMTGYSGEIPTELEAKVITHEQLAKRSGEALGSAEFMKMLRESVREGHLTEGLTEFYKQNGILEDAEDTFHQIYEKNWRTIWGEWAQRQVGGAGNKGSERAQFMNDTEAFDRFMSDESGKHAFEAFTQMGESMQRMMLTSDRLLSAMARPAAQASVGEIVTLFGEREKSRNGILASHRGLNVEIRGRAAVYSWKTVGTEIIRQLKTDIANLTQSSIVRSSAEYDLPFNRGKVDGRVDIDTSVAEIVAEGSNLTAGALHRVRVETDRMVSGVARANVIYRAIQHGLTEVARSMGAKVGLDVFHDVEKDPQGEALRSHREKILHFREVKSGLERIVESTKRRKANK